MEAQPPLLAELSGVDDEAVGDLVEGLDDPVEVGCAHPYPTAVEGGVGAAVDDAAPVGQDLDPVTVPPDSGEHVEVGVAVTLTHWVVPEEDRHGWHGLG